MGRADRPATGCTAVPVHSEPLTSTAVIQVISQLRWWADAVVVEHFPGPFGVPTVVVHGQREVPYLMHRNLTGTEEMVAVDFACTTYLLSGVGQDVTDTARQLWALVTSAFPQATID